MSLVMFGRSYSRRLVPVSSYVSPPVSSAIFSNCGSNAASGLLGRSTIVMLLSHADMLFKGPPLVRAAPTTAFVGDKGGFEM
jgi:hypothetical protein